MQLPQRGGGGAGGTPQYNPDVGSAGQRVVWPGPVAVGLATLSSITLTADVGSAGQRVVWPGPVAVAVTQAGDGARHVRCDG